MTGQDEQEISLLGTHGHYPFDRNADDRQRLEEQFQLMREDFGVWFDQALRLGALSADPKQADWWMLDAGCGEGQYGLDCLARYPKAHLVGTDVNGVAIEAATRTAAAMPNARFIVHDHRQPMPAGVAPARGFDIAFGWFFLYFMPEPKRTLADIAARLAPGGAVLFLNVADDVFKHPDQGVGELRDMFLTMGGRYHVFDVARDLGGWLRELEFSGVRTIELVYPMGGATAHGQRWWAEALGVLAGSRGMVVGGGLISAPEFDRKLDAVAGKSFVDAPGELRLRVTIGRKPR
jgi:SAM-dependent methyltransferase